MARKDRGISSTNSAGAASGGASSTGSSSSSRNVTSHSSSRSLNVPTTTHRARAHSFGLNDMPPVDDSPPSALWAALCCQQGRGALSWTGLGIVCSALACGSLGIHLLLDILGDKLDHIGSGWYTGLGTLGVVLLMVAVPVTHGVAGPRKYGPLYQFMQPFVGGLRFVLLQVLAWTLWTCTMLAGVYGVWVGGKKLTGGWLSAVGVGGVISQILILTSLHFFVSNASTTQTESVEASKIASHQQHHQQRTRAKDAKRRKNHQHATTTTTTSKSKLSDADKTIEPSPPAVLSASPSPEPDTSSSTVFPWSRFVMKVIFGLIATLSMLLAIFVESTEHVSPSTSVSLQSMLTSAILLAVPITHLLARRSLTHAGYVLFQPFKGGSKFVTLQAIAWTLWTLAFISAGFSFFLVVLKHPVAEAAAKVLTAPTNKTNQPGGGEDDLFVIPWPWLSNLITSAGVGAIMSQALVLLSLKYFDIQLSRRIDTTARVIEVARNEATVNTPHARTPNEGGTTTILDTDVYDRAVAILTTPRGHRRSWSAATSPSSVSPVTLTRSQSLQAQLHLHDTNQSTTTPITPDEIRKRKNNVDDNDKLNDLPPLIPVKRIHASMDSIDLVGTDPATSLLMHDNKHYSLARTTFKDFISTVRFSFHYYRTASWTMLFREFLLDSRSLVVIGILYMVPIIGAIFTFVPLIFMYTHYPLPWYFYTIYGTFVLLYLSTYRGRPGMTGSRSWSAVRENQVLWSSLQRYFSGQIIPIGQLSEEKGPYIFGFHPHGIYPMTCMAEVDHRVLTNKGFLFLDQIEAYNEAIALNPNADELLYACHDVITNSLQYRSGKVVFSKPPEHWVEFTDPKECKEWKDVKEKGTYSSSASASSSSSSTRISLRVTPNHRMYVQVGSRDKHGDLVPLTNGGGVPIPYRTIPAEELTSNFKCTCLENQKMNTSVGDGRTVCRHGEECLHGYEAIRFRAASENGIINSSCLTPNDILLQPLQLETNQQLDAFLEIYGFWLTVGSLDAERHSIRFDLSPHRVNHFSHLLTRAGLSAREGDFSHSSNQRYYNIHASHWFEYFKQSHSFTRSNGPTTTTSTATASSSTQRFDDWILRRLDRRQVRIVLEGMSNDDKSTIRSYEDDMKVDAPQSDEAEHVIETSSIEFRDSIIQACLHGGYSAYFVVDKNHSTTTTRYWSIRFSEGSMACAPCLNTSDVRYKYDSHDRQQVVEEEVSTSTRYNSERDGRVWCIEVDHPDHLIIAQRAFRSKMMTDSKQSSNNVTYASKPMIIGNCFWATRGEQFKTHYPGLTIDVCAASIMFSAPFLREICMWAGAREVTGSAIRLALNSGRSVMLVPGGQREMRHSSANKNHLTLVTRHRGFIRMAIQEGKPLVPVLSIGETMLLENVHAPRMQAYTLRTIGVGFPIWPYGRWYSPLPNPHPVVVIFGEPIEVPHEKEPSTELIEEIHKQYYGQLQTLFLQHRHMIPGFEQTAIVYEEE